MGRTSAEVALARRLDPPNLIDPPEYCPACEQDVPLSQFSLGDGETMPRGAFVCRTCRAEGRKPTDLLPALSLKHRRMLRVMMTSDSVADAARKLGLSTEHLRNVINGRGGETHEMVAAAWRRLLEIEGLDLMTVARIGRNLLHALEPKWNPAKECWEFFPDNTTRAKMFAYMTRQHRVDPVSSNKGQFQPKAAVVIINNLGGDQGGKDVEGRFVLEVPADAVSTE